MSVNHPHTESLGDIDAAIDRSLDALDILESVRDVNKSEVREGIVDTLVLLRRLKRATLDRIEHEAKSKPANETQRSHLGPI